jgi:hypothetical protein
VYALLADDLGLVHLLHCVDPLVLLELDAPDLAEAALPDHVLAVEVLSIHVPLIEIDVLPLLLGLQLRQVDFETIFNLLI